MNQTDNLVWKCLSEVMDPEIPVLSLPDLGVITEVSVVENKVLVKMRPTFTGCPAIDQMKLDISERLKKEGFSEVDVLVVREPAWSTDDISDNGRQALKSWGFAPPPKGNIVTDISILEHVACPRCDGENTELRSPFGPTLCRSIHYCFNCEESFQQLKPLN